LADVSFPDDRELVELVASSPSETQDIVSVVVSVEPEEALPCRDLRRKDKLDIQLWRKKY